jgi:cytochrome c
MLPGRLNGWANFAVAGKAASRGRVPPPGVKKAKGSKPMAKGKMMVRTLITATALIAASAGTALAQDVDKGATVFKKCAICHKIGPGATNLVGPELNGLDGRHSGSVAGYSYSDANKNSGIVWNEQTFAEYIKDPRAKVPGTKMIFAGIKNEQEIKDLWAYIKQYDAEGNIKK